MLSTVSPMVHQLCCGPGCPRCGSVLQGSAATGEASYSSLAGRLCGPLGEGLLQVRTDTATPGGGGGGQQQQLGQLRQSDSSPVLQEGLGRIDMVTFGCACCHLRHY
jgi:hypothetical protein